MAPASNKPSSPEVDTPQSFHNAFESASARVFWRLHRNEFSCSNFVFETASLVICYVFEPSPPCGPRVSTCIGDGSGATLARDANRAHRKGFSCSPAVRRLLVLTRLRGWAGISLTLIFADPALHSYRICTSPPFDEAEWNHGRVILRSTAHPQRL